MIEPEKFVTSILESMGFVVNKIPECNKESPDFIVIANNFKYLVELKTKLEDLKKEKKKGVILNSGKIYDDQINISPQNTIAKRIKKASKQLASLKQNIDFRLIWLLALGIDADIKFEQFEMTLFGSVNILDMDEESNEMKPCYYFGNSSFYRFRNIIDGAIVSTSKEARLCINNHSEKYNAFKNSELSKRFDKAIIDPIEIEKNGNGYIVNTDLCRSNKTNILDFVKNKYNKPNLLELNFTSYSSSKAVKHE